MNNSSSSFGTYEAFRIIVPGYYFAALLMCLAWAVAGALGEIPSVEGTRLFLLFVAVGLIAGLTLYAKESTKRRKAFQENQPSQYLKTKARAMADIPVMEESDAQQLYFFILNNHIPSIFHEKIFYFGTIYHIMIQVRRTSLWFAVLATLTAGALLASGIAIGAASGVLVFAAVVWSLYLLNVRYNKADRKMQENYRDQICWLEMNNDLVEAIIRKRTTAQR
jgi:membrane protein implicated in regulation of membrane protease activity